MNTKRLLWWLLARILRGRLSFDSPRWEIQFSALILVTVLLSPHLFTYDLTVLLLPMFLLARQIATGHITSPHRQRLIWLLILLYAVPGISVMVAASIGLQLTVPVMVALLVSVCHVGQASCLPD